MSDEWEDEEELPRRCEPVPCLPFADVKMDVTEVFDWREGAWRTPMGSETFRALRELRDVERAAMTAEQRLSADTAERTLLYGNAYVELVDRMIPLIMEVDPDSEAGRAVRAGVLGGVSVGSFTPHVEEVLATRVRPRYGHEEMLTTPAGTTLRQWGDYPYGLADGPLVIGVPEGYDPVAVSNAVALCQSLGLLPDTPHGILFMPEGADTPD